MEICTSRDEIGGSTSPLPPDFIHLGMHLRGGGDDILRARARILGGGGSMDRGMPSKDSSG